MLRFVPSRFRHRMLSVAWALTSVICASTAWGQAALPTAEVRFEQNATDGDVEVVFEVSGRSEGLAKLSIVGPQGQTVVNFAASDGATMGIRQFVFESPEPTDADAVKNAYPEGKYAFSAVTVSGAKLIGEAVLSHDLPEPATLQSPEEEGEDVPCDDLEIAWSVVPRLAATPHLAATIVEIENSDLDMNLTVRLPGDATRFRVPAGLLRPGVEYDLAIGTVLENGNASFVETSFTTAEAKK